MKSEASAAVPAILGQTLADVLQAIDQADLPAAGRRDMVSGVRTVARLLDAEPTALPASPRLIAVFERFAASLEANLLKQPANALIAARGGWSEAQAVVWPPPPRRADHFCLPWSPFPTSLRQETEAWITPRRGDDLLTATYRPLRPETLSAY